VREHGGDGHAQVAVIERNIAEIAGVDVGERITLTTAAGSAHLHIVGTSRSRSPERLSSRSWS
jgi:hypothetical protein